jgi:Fur family ferric uptake transcriptional regulator
MKAKRSTWQKQAVRDMLSAQENFLSAQELHQKLLAQGQKVGLTTVYRALTELVAASEADSLVIEGAEALYRACGAEHHHHLICTRCGTTVEFELPGFEAATRQIGSEQGFSNLSHNIELFGICSKCGVSG